MANRFVLAAVVVLAVGCSWVTGPGESEGIPPQQQRLAMVGFTHTCLLKADGVPICWGPPLPVSPYSPGGGSLRLVTISGGFSHWCGIAADSSAWCWGSNLYGELGDGTSGARDREPTQVVGGHKFVAIDAGVNASCALTPRGEAYCWGDNANGWVGDGSIGEGRRVTEPTRVKTSLRFRQLVTGSVSCGLALDDRVYCWGRVSGSTDVDFYRPNADCRTVFWLWYQGAPCLTPTPTATTERVAALSSGNYRCLVFLDRRVGCWGDNGEGQLGNGTVGTYHLRAEPVVGDLQVRHVVSAPIHTCALTLDGTAYCWGSNTGGLLGNGEDGLRAGSIVIILEPTPQRVLTDQRFTTIAARAATCALSVEEEVWCWGPGWGNRPVHVPLPK